MRPSTAVLQYKNMSTHAQSLSQSTAIEPRLEILSSQKGGFFRHTLESLHHRIDTKSHLLEAQLFTLALAIGIQDAISVPDYHCFASNQTGNTVLFAVGLLMPSSSAPNNGSAINFSIFTIMTSLGFFVLGVLLSGQAANFFRAVEKRWWLISSSLTQTALVFVAAGLQFGFVDAQAHNTTMGRITLALLAFSSGMQVAMVRAMRITDVTTAMATAAYVDIFIDPRLTSRLWENRGRNRRIAFLVSLVAGSFLGAIVAKEAGSPVAVVVSGALKIVVAFSFFLNDADHSRDETRCADLEGQKC